MREAAGALSEFRTFLPLYCPQAVAHLERALWHFEQAIVLCHEHPAVDYEDQDDPDADGGRGGDEDDDDGDDAPPPLRIKW